MRLLKVNNLSFEIPTLRLLNDVGFEAGPNEYVAVVDPSGSGK